MTRHLSRQGAFGVRMGPPVVTRRWSAAQVKEGIADEAVHRLTDVPPLERSQTGAAVVSQLHELGWRPQAVEGGFAAGQPQYNFVIPLTHADGTPRTEDEVLAGMNQLWRRNIKKAAKQGVVVERGSREDLKAFHDLYVHTAERDHFTPRGLRYFETMYDALSAEADGRISLWTARHEGDLVASTIAIRVGTHAWYSYGASSTEKREVRGSNAVQWAMISDAMAAGAEVYDLRGITDTLDADDSHVGLIQFKVGTGGEAVEYVGEWDLPLNKAALQGLRPLHEAPLRGTPHDAATHRRRRALAPAPARHRDRPPGHRPGLQGQRLRLHHRPAGAPRAVAARARRADRHAGRHDGGRHLPRARPGGRPATTATCWCSPRGAPSAAPSRSPRPTAAASCTRSAGSRTCATSPTATRAPGSCSSSSPPCVATA